MRPRKPRHIQPDELELWKKVVKHADPMHPDHSMPAPKTPAPATPGPSWSLRKGFRVGEAASSLPARHDLSPAIGDHLKQTPVQMDRKRFEKMKRGRLKPEARIDLHGLTLAQAHPALTDFILESAAAERRLVLVITGKGKVRDEFGPIPERHGVLRHQIPHWLHSMPLKLYVLQVAQAHVKHGGAGAYYVYLKRVRG